jgi:hypothetical protein
MVTKDEPGKQESDEVMQFNKLTQKFWQKKISKNFPMNKYNYPAEKFTHLLRNLLVNSVMNIDSFEKTYKNTISVLSRDSIPQDPDFLQRYDQMREEIKYYLNDGNFITEKEKREKADMIVSDILNLYEYITEVNAILDHLGKSK